MNIINVANCQYTSGIFTHISQPYSKDMYDIVFFIIQNAAFLKAFDHLIFVIPFEMLFLFGKLFHICSHLFFNVRLEI